MKTIRVGRSPQNDVVLENDKLVSSQHLQIVCDENKLFYIKDLNSTNGTFLNGRKITGDKVFPLFLSDSIRIGKTELLWQPYFNDTLNQHNHLPESTPKVIEQKLLQPKPGSNNPLWLILGLLVAMTIILMIFLNFYDQK